MTTSQPTSAISPFVQKMMQMEKTGEIITTASVKAQAAAQQQQQQQPAMLHNTAYGPVAPGESWYLQFTVVRSVCSLIFDWLLLVYCVW